MSEQGAGHGQQNVKEKIGAELRAGEAAASKELKKGVDAALRDTDEAGYEERRDIVIHANYEIFVLGFLLVQLVNSALLLLPLQSEQRKIVVEFWLGISIFLIIDALARLRRTPNKRRYLFTYFGWLTWVGSMPVPFVTSARLLATGVVLRKLRRGEFGEIGRVVVSRHAQSTLLLVVFLVVLFFEFGSLMILVAEKNAPDANIRTADDAIWWSLVTISTVGYGDTFPTTGRGRLIGFALIITGVGLFTSTTSFLARWFMRPRTPTVSELDTTQEPTGAQAQIREIRSLLENLDDNHRQTLEELENRLNRLENAVAAQDGEQQSVR